MNNIPTQSINGSQYTLVKDIASFWYPNSVVKTPTTPVVRFLQNNGIPVEKLQASIDDGLGRKRSAVCHVVKSDLLESILSLKSTVPQVIAQTVLPKTSFYIIQKYPKHAPQIIKMGVTGRTVQERITEYYVFNPKVLLERPISRSNEGTLIKMISAGSEQLGAEEFWVEDITKMVDHAKQVLSFLPLLDDNDSGKDDSIT